MRLIDADKLDWWYKGRPIRRVIDEAPTVDAVPVVRCEECVHCYQLIVDGNGFWQEVENGGTHNLCRRNESTFDVRCDDFCSYGERKDNG